VDLPDDLVTLLRRPSPCYITTLMPDGSPQMTQTWVDTDGENVLINTVQGFQKDKNVQRDHRVALNVSDPDQPVRYYEVRGRVTRRPPRAGPTTSRPWPSAISAGPTPGSGAASRPASSSRSHRTRSAAFSERVRSVDPAAA
jgi:PPOX class probable F420-dependent enzyme